MLVVKIDKASRERWDRICKGNIENCPEVPTGESYISKDECTLEMSPYGISSLLDLFRKDFESGNATIGGKTKEETA